MTFIKYVFRNFAEVICSIALAVLICVISMDVFMRSVFNISRGGLQEMAIIAFSWVTFLGMSVVYKRKGHVSMDFLFIMLPIKTRMMLTILINILLALTNIFLMWQSIIFSISVYKRPTDILRLPYAVMSIPAIIGFFINSIYSVIFFIQSTAEYRSGGVPDQ